MAKRSAAAKRKRATTATTEGDELRDVTSEVVADWFGVTAQRVHTSWCIDGCPHTPPAVRGGDKLYNLKEVGRWLVQQREAKKTRKTILEEQHLEQKVLLSKVNVEKARRTLVPVAIVVAGLKFLSASISNITTQMARDHPTEFMADLKEAFQVMQDGLHRLIDQLVTESVDIE